MKDSFLPSIGRSAAFVTLGRFALSLLVAAAVWLPGLHLLFHEDEGDAFMDDRTPARARALAQQELAMWRADGPDIQTLHQGSAEWDFMGRMFSAWSFAEMALRDPARKAELLLAIDGLIEGTLRLEKEKGFQYFLLPYGRARPFVAQPARSLFVDGELALAVALRRLVED